MKKIVAFVIATILLLSTCAWASPVHKYNMSRCPFCGTEDMFIWYGEPGNSFGTCMKCGQNTLRYNFRVNIRSYGNNDDLIEARLMQGGNVVRLNQATGNDTFVEFVSVQQGWYQLVITRGNAMIYNQMVFIWCDMTINAFQARSLRRW